MSEQENNNRSNQGRSLRSALHKARLSQAERNDVIVDLREAEQARLELLHDELQPVFDDMPENYDQFECALVPGDPPRLWLDMLTYVVMGPDKRSYHMVKDMRDGRQTMHETPNLTIMADYVTEYLAHRIIERERALDDNVPKNKSAPDLSTSPLPQPVQPVEMEALAANIVSVQSGVEGTQDNSKSQSEIVYRGYRGATIFFSFLSGLCLGALALLVIGALLATP